MLETIARAEPRFTVVVSEGGLYAEIAAEGADFFGPGIEVVLLCGRDAAERIADWDYGRPGAFEDMLRRHRLLVAARAGEYNTPPQHTAGIVSIPLVLGTEGVSSSEVRRLIREGKRWEHLVPAVIVDQVRGLYVID